MKKIQIVIFVCGAIFLTFFIITKTEPFFTISLLIIAFGVTGYLLNVLIFIYENMVEILTDFRNAKKGTITVRYKIVIILFGVFISFFQPIEYLYRALKPQE